VELLTVELAALSPLNLLSAAIASVWSIKMCSLDFPAPMKLTSELEAACAF
jgi:hypothetical protein